jgi:hypothetical protein
VPDLTVVDELRAYLIAQGVGQSNDPNVTPISAVVPSIWKEPSTAPPSRATERRDDHADRHAAATTERPRAFMEETFVECRRARAGRRFAATLMQRQIRQLIAPLDAPGGRKMWMMGNLLVEYSTCGAATSPPAPSTVLRAHAELPHRLPAQVAGRPAVRPLEPPAPRAANESRAHLVPIDHRPGGRSYMSDSRFFVLQGRARHDHDPDNLKPISDFGLSVATRRLVARADRDGAHRQHPAADWAQRRGPRARDPEHPIRRDRRLIIAIGICWTPACSTRSTSRRRPTVDKARKETDAHVDAMKRATRRSPLATSQPPDVNDDVPRPGRRRPGGLTHDPGHRVRHRRAVVANQSALGTQAATAAASTKRLRKATDDTFKANKTHGREPYVDGAAYDSSTPYVEGSAATSARRHPGADRDRRAVFARHIGVDVVTGAADPWTHTISSGSTNPVNQTIREKTGVSVGPFRQVWWDAIFNKITWNVGHDQNVAHLALACSA